MPAISISSVDTVNDVLTAVAHGLLTGDRLRVRTNSVLPTGLSGATDYFAIRVDVDNIKVATSSANALAGTPWVDITAAGSSSFVEYGLPYCIPTALAAAGTQLKSANDNGVWAALVAIYGVLSGQAQSVWSAITLAVSLVLAPNQSITVSGTGLYKHGTQTLVIPILIGSSVSGNSFAGQDFQLSGANAGVQSIISLPVGKRILAVRARIKDSATGPTKCRVTIRSENDGVSTILGTPVLSSGAGVVQTIQQVGLTTVVAAVTTYSIVVDLQTGTTASHVYAFEVDYDQP